MTQLTTLCEHAQIWWMYADDASFGLSSYFVEGRCIVVSSVFASMIHLAFTTFPSYSSVLQLSSLLQIATQASEPKSSLNTLRTQKFKGAVRLRLSHQLIHARIFTFIQVFFGTANQPNINDFGGRRLA